MNTGGLKYRLIKLQIMMTIVMLLLSWILITINDYSMFKSLSIQSFETTARILSRNLSTCLAFKDQEECQRVLNTLKDEKGILKALVIDPSHKTISSFQKKTDVSIRHNFKDLTGDGFRALVKENTIHATYPIFDSGTLEGRLYLIAEFDMIEKFMKRHAIFFFFIILGSVVISAFLSTHFQRKITSQINLILQTINKIRNQRNYHLRTINQSTLEVIDIDEFKQLAHSFDDMIEQIESRDQSLQERNVDLEKMVEEKVQELYKEKEKLVQNAELASLGEMAGGIAHEINNPLAIIKVSTSSLTKMLAKDKFDKDFFIDSINDIDQTVERIAKIITGLRNISRRSEFESKTVCTFQEIFDDVFCIATVKFKSAGIELKNNYSPEDLSKKFMTNRVQLSQVLVNLLNNAYDAISEYEDKWIDVQIDFTSDVIIKITDSGNGIPEEVRKRMFNPFYTTKEIGKGTGIGLSISKSIIEKIGGKFFYDDTSKNTRFIIQIPFEKEAA